MDLYQEADRLESSSSECDLQQLLWQSPPSSTAAIEQNADDDPEQDVPFFSSFPAATHSEYESGPIVITANRPTRESVLQRLSEALLRRSLTKIDLSQRGLMPSDARLVKMALLQNAQLSILKLGYNNLGDEGVTILSAGISQHHNLQSLDLGFNNIGNQGCHSLCSSVPNGSHLHTLYLAGNHIGEDGAFSIADLIRRGSSLRKLYLTGNLLGSEGVSAISEAIFEDEQKCQIIDSNLEYDQMLPDDLSEEKKVANGPSFFSNNDLCSLSSVPPANPPTVEQLFLGGSGIGPSGCNAICCLVRCTRRLRVLSLPNCDIGDESVALLASSMKSNRENLPLEYLQLSFNRISCRGMESLSNAVWGSRTLKELLIDNNEIADRGTQQIAAVLPHVKTLENLNLGFNQIKVSGIKLLMKAVVDSTSITSISVSGNPVDTSAAKAIAYALAYNTSLISMSVVHCNIGYDGQRHISAGIVSNSKTSLREFLGFKVGPIVVTLGFPAALEHWNNVQLLNFIHLMWKRNGSMIQSSNPFSKEEEEKMNDPLHFLGDTVTKRTAPLEATIVVEVAKKAFTSLVAEGYDLFSRRPENSDASTSPLTWDGIMVESLTISPNFSEHETQYPPACFEPTVSNEAMPTQKTKSFVATPEASKSNLPDPSRKKRIVEWLCANIQHINKLAQLPFSSAELWKLHQHYFTPVVNESGGSVSSSPNESFANSCVTLSSVPEVSKDCPGGNPGNVSSMCEPHSNSTISSAVVNPLSSAPILKRKVSYRFLGDAAIGAASTPLMESRQSYSIAQNHHHVSLMIEGTHHMSSLPPKTKRARRNRSRISFLPRVKAKLDSYLDVCHEKALITMRQLYYVEQAILRGQVNPIEPSLFPRKHLCGVLAADAETIVVDMI